MDKVTVRILGLSQALSSLGIAGCKEVMISLVPNALKVEGIDQDGKIMVLHVWSKEAEDTAAAIGAGERELTVEEAKYFEAGKCPLCKEHGQLYKGPKTGLAYNISCEAGHTFWAPPFPWVPEYLGEHKAPVNLESEAVGEKPTKAGKAEEETPGQSMAEEIRESIEEVGEESS